MSFHVPFIKCLQFSLLFFKSSLDFLLFSLSLMFSRACENVPSVVSSFCFVSIHIYTLDKTLS